jgi:predicted naringenin-chalcone synthase
MTIAHINKITTAVPEHDFQQQFVEYAAHNFENPKAEQIFRRMVGRSQVTHRWGVMPDLVGFFGGDPNSMSIDGRMQAFKEHAPRLAIDAVNNLELGDEAAAVTHLIIVTCTGFFTPGLDFAIIDNCGVPSDVERTQVAFMGCFSGINGLKLAHHIVRSDPDARVLVVALEICSIHLQGSQNVDKSLSHLLFGDGCAAALVTAEESGIAMDSFKAFVTPDTADLMTLNISSTSIEMFLSGQVPLALGKALKQEEVMKLILSGAEKSSIDLWAIHPGGRSILDAVGGAVELSEEELAVSRHVLDNYGNLASATILFVFAELLRRKDSEVLTGSTGCALAFGPGLTTESMLFRAV